MQGKHPLFLLFLSIFWATTTIAEEPQNDFRHWVREKGSYLLSEREQKPLAPPFTIPTFRDTESYKKAVPKLKKMPKIPTDLIYQSVINCYPAKSLFEIDVSLKAGVGAQTDLDDYDNENKRKHFVQVVAEMPLYSTTEFARARELERHRRKDLAKMVASFARAISERNRAVRSLGLYETLEKRASERVRLGIVGAHEQIAYLEKVLTWEEKLEHAKTKIAEMRLALVGQCRPEARGEIDYFLRRLGE